MKKYDGVTELRNHEIRTEHHFIVFCELISYICNGFLAKLTQIRNKNIIY